MSLSNLFKIAASAATANAIRLNLVASNITNAESVTSSSGMPYKGRYAVFSAIPINTHSKASLVKVVAVVEDQSPPRLKYEPGHPLADARGYVTYPNVNLVEVTADMIAAANAYRQSIEVMHTAKAMHQKLLQLGK